MKEFFSAKNLCYSYIKKPLCLKDVNFSIEKNSKALVLGLDESGKTTLVNVLSGFDDKYFGQIIYNDQQLKTIPDNEKNFSIIYKSPVLLNSTIDKNFNFLFETLKIDGLSDDEKLELLEKFDLNCKLKDKVKNLSLLDKFKFCLIRVFIKKSAIVFIDDIFDNGFSSEEVSELEKLIKVATEDRAVIFSANEKSFLSFGQIFDEFGFDYIYYLNKAKLIKFKSIEQFKENPFDLEACFFLNDLNKAEGYCVYQDGSYFLVVDEKFTIKIDKSLDRYFKKLKIENNEDEDIVLCYKKSLFVDFLKNNDINMLLKNNQLMVFSKLNSLRII